MPAIDPVTEAQRWLMTTLTDDAGVTAIFGSRIHRHPAPREETYPLLTHQFMGGPDDLLVVGTDTFWSTLRFLIRGTVEGDDTLGLGTGAAAVYAALHGTFGETANARINSCIRERVFEQNEFTNSVQYSHLGGFYLVRISAK